MCPEYSVSYLSITTEGPPCEGLFVFVFLANLFRTPQFEPGRAKRADRLRSEARQPKGRAAAGSESISPGPLSAIPGVDSSLRPSALRANVQGVVQICFADLSRHLCVVHIARQTINVFVMHSLPTGTVACSRFAFVTSRPQRRIRSEELRRCCL